MNWKRVGQRVRYARPAFEVNTNNTGVISELVPEEAPYAHWPDWTINCLVRWDSPVYQEKPDGSKRTSNISYTHTDRLEPIVDDGRRVISWRALENLWTPDSILEKAS